MRGRIGEGSGRIVGLGLVLALGLALGILARPPRAAAIVYTRYDFESPSYGASGRLISDFCVLKVSGVWHIFYTEFPSPGSFDCHIGHAVSTDLVHWSERPIAIGAGGASWMSTGVWAPHVIDAPGGGWRMLFAGRNLAGAQSIGSLSSADLDTWTLTSPEPVLIPSAWARWDEATTSSCRDPFVWFDTGAGQYRMIYTAITNLDEAAIGLAGSPDLLNWTDLGPFVVDPRVPLVAELESPFLSFDNGRVELLYSQVGTNMLTAPSLAGPWDVLSPVSLDVFARAPELVKDGTIRMLHRIRGMPCGVPTAFVLTDTVSVTSQGYAVPGPPQLTTSWLVVGDAFIDDPVFGDAPLLRGEPAVSPGGFRWLASGEQGQIPSCPFPPVYEATGSVSTPQFLLRGDVMRLRVGGAASPDSAYVALVDDCTGEELEKQTGTGSNGLVPVTWSNAGRRGWPVRVKLVDKLARPGGVIGLDDVEDTAVVDVALPAPPNVLVTRPIVGENLTGGSTFTIRWNGSSPAGLDSFLVYVSYDNFTTAPIKIAKRNANQFTYNWPVPIGTQFGVKVRVVAYAKNAVHGCHTSGAFNISATVDAPSAGTGGALRLAALGSPGRTPTLVWSTPGPGAARLEVYDALGRRVRALAAAEGPGERRTPWDGTDDRGRSVAPGVYFARLSCDQGERTLPIVRLARCGAPRTEAPRRLTVLRTREHTRAEEGLPCSKACPSRW